MDEGSYGGGFALGLIFGVIGLILAITINKPETRKGAVHGFLFRIVLAIIGVLCFIIYLKLFFLGFETRYY